MATPRGGEALRNAIERKLGRVTVPAEVSDDDLLKRRLQLGEDARRGGVGEMPVAGENALFDRPGSPGVPLKEFFIVVRFDQKGPNPAQHFENQPGGVAEIGEHTKARTIRRNAEADGIGGVMRDRKRADRETAERELRTGLKQLPVSVPEPGVLEGSGGEGIAKDRQRVTHEQHLQSAGVVAVLVGKEDAGKLLRRGARRQ